MAQRAIKKVAFSSLTGFKSSIKPNLSLRHGGVLARKPQTDSCLLPVWILGDERPTWLSIMAANCKGISTVHRRARMQAGTVNVNEGGGDKHNCVTRSFLCSLIETLQKMIDCPFQKLFRALIEELPGYQWSWAGCSGRQHRFSREPLVLNGRLGGERKQITEDLSGKWAMVLSHFQL